MSAASVPLSTAVDIATLQFMDEAAIGLEESYTIINFFWAYNDSFCAAMR